MMTAGPLQQTASLIELTRVPTSSHSRHQDQRRENIPLIGSFLFPGQHNHFPVASSGESLYLGTQVQGADDPNGIGNGRARSYARTSKDSQAVLKTAWDDFELRRAREQP
jgi:hypothetical protein